VRTAFFRVSDRGIFLSLDPLGFARSTDRLYLVSLSGTHEFRPVFDALSTMGFYNLNPAMIRDLQPPHPGEILARDGANISGVIQRLAARNPDLKGRIAEYLGQVVPSITGIEPISLGPRETLAFSQRVPGAEEPLQFWAENMSDGTLRALGILVALFQGELDENNPPLLVGIEEPETALHPAAAGVLLDAMRDATSIRQVLVTSHSPELLDNVSIADSEILAVVAHNGATRIGRLDEAGRSVLEDELFSAGDLLRMNQLRPDPAAGSPNPDELKLFEEGAPA
jgi:predicted ATPase